MQQINERVTTGNRGVGMQNPFLDAGTDIALFKLGTSKIFMAFEQQAK